MVSLLRLSVPAAVLLGLLACSGGSGTAEPVVPKPAPTPAELVGTKLAEVNGNMVGSVAWEEASKRLNPADGTAWSAEEKASILDEIIEEELMFQDAFAKGLYQDPKVRRLLINLLLRDAVYDRVKNEDFTEEELQAHFEEHKEEFVVPEKVQVKRIFVAVNSTRTDAEALALAEKLHARVVANPEAFREIATENSDGPFARRGGELGYVDESGKPGIPEMVIKRAFALDEGGITEPFLNGGGYNIIYVPTRRERVERTFEQMRGAVLRRLKNERYEQMIEEFSNKLREAAKVEIAKETLDGWNPPAPQRPGFNGRVHNAPPPPFTEGGEEEPTGDPIRDEGDANDEARKRMEAMQGEEVEYP